MEGVGELTVQGQALLHFTSTPALLAKQILEYVFPSMPHTGSEIFGQFTKLLSISQGQALLQTTLTFSFSASQLFLYVCPSVPHTKLIVSGQSWFSSTGCLKLGIQLLSWHLHSQFSD